MMNFIINSFANVNNAFVSMGLTWDIIVQALVAVSLLDLLRKGVIWGAIKALLVPGDHDLSFEGGALLVLARVIFTPVFWTLKAIRWFYRATLGAMLEKRAERLAAEAAEAERLAEEAKKAAAIKAKQDAAMADLGLNVGRLADSLESIDQRTARLEGHVYGQETVTVEVEEDTVVPPVVVEATDIVDEALPSLDELVAKREKEIADAVKAYRDLNVKRALAMINATDDDEIKEALIAYEHGCANPRKGVCKHFPMA